MRSDIRQEWQKLQDPLCLFRSQIPLDVVVPRNRAVVEPVHLQYSHKTPEGWIKEK